MATASEDGTVKVWDVESGKGVLNLDGHSGRGERAAWSPDGKRLATAAWDSSRKVQSTRVWDSGGKAFFELGGHTGRVTSVAWSPDGKRLATASADGTVQVYAMDIHDLMALAHQRVTAHPSAEGCKKYFHADKCPPAPELSFW